jgi:hypothetical protein
LKTRRKTLKSEKNLISSKIPFKLWKRQKTFKKFLNRRFLIVPGTNLKLKESHRLMGKKSGKEKFITLFIQVHILTVLWAFVIGVTAGILSGLISYLLLVHLLTLIAYIKDLEGFDFHKINRKILRS